MDNLPHSSRKHLQTRLVSWWKRTVERRIRLRGWLQQWREGMPDRKCKNISSIKVDTDLSCCDLCSLRVGNKQQPVHSYGHNWEGRKEDKCRLWCTCQLAQNFLNEKRKVRKRFGCVFHLTCPDTRGQYLWMRSSMVSGMVNRHRNMLDRAKVTMKMFRVVVSIWKLKIYKT